MRHDIVRGYPEDVHETAYTSHGTHGMYKPGRFMSIQGHPEYNSEMMRWLIEARHARGLFREEVYEDGITRVVRDSDGPKVMKRFLEFLLER